MTIRDLRSSIEYSVNWCKANNVPLPMELRVQMKKAGIFDRSFKAANGSYTDTRSAYWSAIYDDVHDYIESTDRNTQYKNDFRQALQEAFAEAADVAWQDAGNDLPIDDDTQSYVDDQTSAEMW